MRSNRGESLFMTDQYARVAKSSSSLDKRVCAFSRREPALTGGTDCRYADTMATRGLIVEKFTKTFAPASLHAGDESPQHARPPGHSEGGGHHFRDHFPAQPFPPHDRLHRPPH